MDESVIRNEIERGIAQVDDALSVIDFACIFDEPNRCIKVSFTAKKPNEETIRGDVAWQ